MPINRATRSETPEIRRAIPIARPVAQPEIRRAIPVEKGWTPRSANPSADPAVARRKSLFSSGATRAERVPADGPVKQYKGYTALSQLDYPKEKLGNGNKTIATHGCFLTSMTMASTGLTGQKLTPATSNVIVRNGDGFSGGGLEPPRAARALGMRLVERPVMNDRNAAAVRGKLDAWLASGKPAIAGVDLGDGRSTGTAGSDADHFILIVDKNKDGSYAALDPLGGRKITLKVNEQGRLVSPKIIAGDRPYRVDELALLEKR